MANTSRNSNSEPFHLHIELWCFSSLYTNNEIHQIFVLDTSYLCVKCTVLVSNSKMFQLFLYIHIFILVYDKETRLRMDRENARHSMFSSVLFKYSSISPAKYGNINSNDLCLKMNVPWRWRTYCSYRTMHETNFILSTMCAWEWVQRVIFLRNV